MKLVTKISVRTFYLLFSLILCFPQLEAQGQFDPGKSRGMPAYPFPVEVTQADGDKIMLRGMGNRMVHWYETPEGYSVLNDKKGRYVYAVRDDEGNMLPSDYIVSSSKGNLPPELEPNLRFSRNQIADFSENYFSRDGAKSNPLPFPNTGTNDVLVILVEFPDQPASSTAADFDLLMNQPDYRGVGSFRDYYLDMSYGNLVLNSTIHDWVQVSHNMSYYGANDEFGYDLNPQALVREALDLLEARGTDFSQYDNDADGYVDEIVVYHAGYGEQFTDAGDTCIWSHAFHLGSQSVVYDGVILDNYIIGPELYNNTGSEITSVGTMVHEFAHSLAIPDFYDVDFEGSGGYAWDLNFWDLMASGSWNFEGISPAGLNAWTKEYMGWMTIPTISESGIYTLNNVYENQEAYRILTGTENEYFILENRQWYGFDYDLPGFGMLIYHVDENYKGWESGYINVDPLHQGFDMEEADNIRDSLTIDGDSYPGWDSIRSFTPSTRPASMAWDGRSTHISLTNITQTDSIITFNLGNAIYNDVPAEWTIDQGLYADSGVLVASVILNASMAANGYLSAFVNDECRGTEVATYYADSGYYVFNMTVYGNSGAGEVLSFRYYDPQLDSTYLLLETIDFDIDTIAGNRHVPFILNVPATYNRVLAAGWNWFSLNVELDNMSPNNVLGACAVGGDYVKSQTESSIYYDGYGWFGTLNEVSTDRLYMLKIASGCELNFSGRAVDLLEAEINLVSGWNWVSYVPQVSMPISEALASLSPASLDYIKNQSFSSLYYEGYGWFGTLNTLLPGDGYMMQLTRPDILRYPASGSAKKFQSANNDNIASDFDPHNFEYNGTINATVFVNGEVYGNTNDKLYAYMGNECRGIVSARYFEPTGRLVFPLMVYAYQEQGEELTFRYWDSAQEKFYDCDETVFFRKDMVLGDAINTIDLNINSLSSQDNKELIPDTQLSVQPNPFKESLVIGFKINANSNLTLEVYDISGRLLESLVNSTYGAGEYTYTWTPKALENGSYLLRLKSGDKNYVKHITHIQ